jgi:O-antigen ligase
MTEARADVVAAIVVGAAIVAAAFGSAIQRDLFHVGRPSRWALLVLLLVVALWRAWLTRGEWRVRTLPAVLVVSFLALCVVSAGWSTTAHSTLGRSAAEIVVVVAALLLAGCVAARPPFARTLAVGVLAAIGVIAVGSALYWLVHRSGFYGAFQPASTQYPRRFRGLEFNPNTLAMQLAVGMPLALAFVRGRRPWALVLLALFVVELALTGSRGGLLAGFGAGVVTALVLPAARNRRLLLVGGVLVALVVTAWASTIPKALPATAPSKAPVTHTRGINAEQVLPLSGEVGNPWWTHHSEQRTLHRSFFNTSVRGRALVGALHRWLERPLLGWGYGAETDAFISRYYGFDSQNPENGYVGILLQLGIVGLVLLLALLAACFVPGLVATAREPNATGAAIVGAAAAGILLALSQSFFHGPGGVIFVAFWVSLLLASVLGLSPARARPAG